MPLHMDKFYTMQVHLHSHWEKDKLVGTPIEFKDLSFDQLQQTRKIVWTQGIFIEMSPITFELVDPLRIKHIYFLEQPQKFAQ